jgi:hypothetical protein
MELDNEDATRSREEAGGSLRLRDNGEYEDDEEEEEGEDNEMDLLRMLRQDSEPEDGQNQGQREEYELVPESMASYLNRKTALLMLWFPLGVSLFAPTLSTSLAKRFAHLLYPLSVVDYILVPHPRIDTDVQYVMLFSISLIRVIYDFAGETPTVLRALSRWFVFAQGVLDAIIYGLVEWQ